MAYVPCAWYYENILGDNCDNKCYNCLGDKDVYICKVDFKAVGDFLEEITIEKDSLWELVFINDDHVSLYASDGIHKLYLDPDFFDSHFESFIYTEMENE